MIQPCIGTPLSEDEISATVDGESAPSVVEHLARCAFCRQRLERAALMELSFGARLYRFDCPDPIVLCDHRFGLLAADEEQRVRTHVADCPHCAAELATFAALDTPAAEPARQPEPGKQRGLIGGLREQIARLVTVSPPLSLEGGLRGAEETQVALYETSDLQVLLSHKTAADQRISVAGEVVMKNGDPDVAGTLVQLFQDQTPVRTAFVDEFSCFSLDVPAPGVYTLCLSAGDQLILVEIEL